MKKTGCFLILSLLLLAPAPVRDLRADYSLSPMEAAAVSAAEAPADDSNFQPLLVAQNGSQEGYSHTTWTYQPKPPDEQTEPPKRSLAAEPAVKASPEPAAEEPKPDSRRRPLRAEPKVTVIQLSDKKPTDVPAGRSRAAEAEALPAPQKSLVEMYHPDLNAANSGQAGPEAPPRPERQRQIQAEPPKTTLTYRRTDNVLPPRPAAAPAAALAAPALKEPSQAQGDQRKTAQPSQAAQAASPVAVVPAQAGLPPDQDLAQAYLVFDQKYMGSLGKSRKELKEWWGFPLVKLGENENEIAYGFRQRGIINVPPPPPPSKAKGKKTPQIQPTSYYASGDMMPQNPDQRSFACLMILWVDEKGKGVVVDGDAVGDCFSVEALTHKPIKFER